PIKNPPARTQMPTVHQGRRAEPEWLYRYRPGAPCPPAHATGPLRYAVRNPGNRGALREALSAADKALWSGSPPWSWDRTKAAAEHCRTGTAPQPEHEFCGLCPVPADLAG